MQFFSEKCLLSQSKPRMTRLIIVLKLGVSMVTSKLNKYSIASFTFCLIENLVSLYMSTVILLRWKYKHIIHDFRLQ